MPPLYRWKWGEASLEHIMKNPQQDVLCSICKKSVTPRQEFYVDANGKVFHAECCVKRVSLGNELERKKTYLTPFADDFTANGIKLARK
jgi:hypothetical protein